jgi:hypothetical protein
LENETGRVFGGLKKYIMGNQISSLIGLLFVYTSGNANYGE